ncbi:MAG: hypothetical protein JWQ38_953 [Flavipsychrobacter sp.]|nr:hypothetical protein [Flavipsychrobacter sp.]
MKEYLLVFRATEGANRRNESEAAASMELWKNWIGSIAQNGKLVGGQPLVAGGKLMTKGGQVTDAPFAEGKEVLNGYLMIKADHFEEAQELSKGCPIFDDKGGSLEIREIATMNM